MNKHILFLNNLGLSNMSKTIRNIPPSNPNAFFIMMRTRMPTFKNKKKIKQEEEAEERLQKRLKAKLKKK